MAHYRLYFMNTASGHIDIADDLESADDLAAINAAKNLLKDQPVELWCGTRKVHRFEMPCPAAAAEHCAESSAEEVGRAENQLVEMAH